MNIKYTDVINQRNTGKDYQPLDKVEINGQKGEVMWINTAGRLLEETEFWNDIIVMGDKLAEVKLENGNFIYIIF